MRLVRRGHEPAWLPVAAFAVALLVTVVLSAIPILVSESPLATSKTLLSAVGAGENISAIFGRSCVAWLFLAC